MRPEDRDATTRAICRERCAFMGEPPCWDVGAWPNEECDEPGCAAMADAALAAAAPLIQKAERGRVLQVLDDRRAGHEEDVAIVRGTAGCDGAILYRYQVKTEESRDCIAAIRALGDEG